MPNMNSSKRARQQDSIKNLPTCGGNKKSGLMRFVGMDSSLSLGRFGATPETQPGLPCTGTLYTCIRNQTCAGGVGKQVNMRHCGEGAPRCGEENGGDGLPVSVGGTGTLRIRFRDGTLLNFLLNPTFWRSPGTIMKTFPNDPNILITSINKNEESVGFSSDFSGSEVVGGPSYYYSSLTATPKKLKGVGGDLAIAYNINNKGNILGYSYSKIENSILFWEKYDQEPEVITPPAENIRFVNPETEYSFQTLLNNNGDFLVDAIVSRDTIELKIAFYIYKNGQDPVELKQQINTTLYTESNALEIGENNDAVGRIGKKIVDEKIEKNDNYQPVLWTKINEGENNEVKILSKNVNGEEINNGEIYSINSRGQMVGILYEERKLSPEAKMIFVGYENSDSDPVEIPKPTDGSVLIPLSIKIGENGDIIANYFKLFFNEGQDLISYDIIAFYHKNMKSEGIEYSSSKSSYNAVLVTDFISKSQ